MIALTRATLAVVAAVLFAAMAHAQQPAPAKSPFGTPLPPSAAAQTPDRASEVGVLDRAWSWLLETQNRLNRDMAGAVRQLKSDNPIMAAMTLIAIAFAYGVLHAAGPGHGKAIISSYVLANEETVRRGIQLSFLAALFQAISAIVFIGVLAIVLRQTSVEMRGAEATIESISWALVAVVGAVLLWRQISGLVSGSTGAGAQAGQAHSHIHDHHDRHRHEHHHHDHGPGCGCGSHSHMPAPKDLQGAWSWRRALPLALSVGIRPCTGALLLLIFALSQGMIWAGVLGTFAMALGTAITVSILAAMAVGSRNWAERASGAGSVWAGRIHTAAGLAGAFLVFGLGSAFFIASLKGGAPL